MGVPVPQEDLPPNYSFSPMDIALQQEGVSGEKEKYIRALYGQESTSGVNTKTSNQGAVGGMQIKPSTFDSVSEDNWDIHNPVHNARAGIRYALEMLDKGDGDFKKGAVGYYGGPSAIKAYEEGIYHSDIKNPSAPNTNQYAEKVVSRMGKISVVRKQQIVPENDIPKLPSTFPSDTELEKMNEQDMFKLRNSSENIGNPKVSEKLAPYEHNKFWKEWVHDHPGTAIPSAMLIPIYQGLKKIGVDMRVTDNPQTPASWKQLTEAEKGVFEGFMNYFSERK